NRDTSSFRGIQLQRYGHSFLAGTDDGCEGGRVLLNRHQEIPHLAALVHDIVDEQQPARPQPREDQVEEPLVIALPGVEEYEIEVAGEPWKLFERVARNPRHRLGQSGAADIVLRDPRPRRIVLDAGEPAADRFQAETDPDRAVAERAADFDRP